MLKKIILINLLSFSALYSVWPWGKKETTESEKSSTAQTPATQTKSLGTTMVSSLKQKAANFANVINDGAAKMGSNNDGAAKMVSNVLKAVGATKTGYDIDHANLDDKYKAGEVGTMGYLGKKVGLLYDESKKNGLKSVWNRLTGK